MFKLHAYFLRESDADEDERMTFHGRGTMWRMSVIKLLQLQMAAGARIRTVGRHKMPRTATAAD